MAKKLIWGGFFVGSTIGGFVPALWGGDMVSVSGLVWSFIGGFAGIYVGYRISQSI